MPSFSRRKTSRVQTPESILVYWSCAGRNDVLYVRNLSFGGVFIATQAPPPLGDKAQIDFLVEEGQIRTRAVVRHVKGSSGTGLEFTEIAQEDRPHLAALLMRLRGMSRSRNSSC
jgi:c-di-GMP-binding flagellar brake protein YcgR